MRVICALLHLIVLTNMPLWCLAPLPREALHREHHPPSALGFCGQPVKSTARLGLHFPFVVLLCTYADHGFFIHQVTGHGCEAHQLLSSAKLTVCDFSFACFLTRFIVAAIGTVKCIPCPRRSAAWLRCRCGSGEHVVYSVLDAFLASATTTPAENWAL